LNSVPAAQKTASTEVPASIQEALKNAVNKQVPNKPVPNKPPQEAAVNLG
jgi:hypothetical protein